MKKHYMIIDTETEISFSFNGTEYTLKLVKHRKKKLKKKFKKLLDKTP